MSKDDTSEEMSSEFVTYTVHIPPTPDHQPMSVSQTSLFEDINNAAKPERLYISGTIFTGGFNSVTRGHVIDRSIEVTKSLKSGLVCGMKGCDDKAVQGLCECGFKICRDCYLDCVGSNGVGHCPGCKEPYKDVDDEELDEDDEAKSEEEDQALPLPKLDKRLSLVKSTKAMNHPPDFDHTRWLFETKGTYEYGNAVWPKDGYGAGSGANGFEHPPDFGERSRRPLTRKVGVFAAILSPYRRRSDAYNAHEELRAKKKQMEMGGNPSELIKVPKATWMSDGNVSPTNAEPVQAEADGENMIDTTEVDIRLPMLVYVSREKRPGYDHNKKAGAMNALVTTSAIMSNGPFNLNLDCDHYIYNWALREGMCFMLDRGGDRICYVQFPQREPLDAATVAEAISVISCFYEDKTEWGKRVGWIYGSVTEDVVTGYRMHNRGCRSVYCVTKRDAFRGTAPINLTDRLHQVLRWATGRSCKDNEQYLSTVEQAAWRGVLQLLGFVPSLPICKRLDGKKGKDRSSDEEVDEISAGSDNDGASKKLAKAKEKTLKILEEDDELPN
ncbi:hypothetical protein GH714_037794 [Hevea brasiliensis]|uniref:Uncharacterized protein n=1 Tax=Hevea brasiliensis TaxID=3981 RepID=A0A6A6LUT6_HEVBR|nr:hypothetical protein GH714_037794 [Hevea brasiliensis]